MLAHSQGTFCTVVDFGINTTAPAIGLSRVHQKTIQATLHVICLFLAARSRTLTCSYSSKILLQHSTGNIESNPLEPHFQTSATMSLSLEGTKTAVALPHCSESTKDHRRVVDSGIDGEAGVMAELRTIVRKKYRGRGASRCGFVPRTGFFCGRCNTGAQFFFFFIF